MIILSTIEELRKWRESVTQKTVGFVPTMGALHEGHTALLDEARKSCDQVLLSIFVNPAQFGPNEDLSKYPRTLEADLEKAKRHGVNAVFVPSADEIYPKAYSTYIDENSVSVPLCGRFRPGHFRGVVTIVFRLFQWSKPAFAFFGLKDAQQFFVIRKMVEDLALDLKLVGIDTVRESDGLAMSSRNVYLSPEHRTVAPLIYQALKSAQAELREGKRWPDVRQTEEAKLREAEIEIQYFDYLQLPNFNPIAEGENSEDTILAIAAYLGKTRLIDNLISYKS